MVSLSLILHQVFLTAFVLSPKRAFDDSQFSDYEVEVLYDVIKQYGKYTAEQLVDILHREGSLWHKVVKENNLEQQFELKNNRSDFVGFVIRSGIFTDGFCILLLEYMKQ